jgi:SAM-dependent methyltransferase
MVNVRDLTVDSPLRDSYKAATPAHYAWQTEGAYVADRERELVRAAFFPLEGRVLDLGCGEGATLYHLGEPEGATGVDLFEEKIAFARGRLPKCRFVAASALDLPFDKGSFDHVLVRDVIHHIPEPARLMDEVARVLAPGGRVDVLEPCRYNPLIAVHALAIPVERGELRSTEGYLAGLLGRHFDVRDTTRHQGFPIHRIVFHPDLGKPAWAKNATVRGLVGGFERVAEKVLPELLWAYLHMRAFGR